MGTQLSTEGCVVCYNTLGILLALKMCLGCAQSTQSWCRSPVSEDWGRRQAGEAMKSCDTVLRWP